jgi:hypothetical protein
LEPEEVAEAIHLEAMEGILYLWRKLPEEVMALQE